MIAENYHLLMERLGRRSKAYRFVFGAPGTANHDFLVDIMAFCRVNETAWSDDARHHARLEGRREVGLRILDHLRLEPDEIVALYRAVRLRDMGENK